MKTMRDKIVEILKEHRTKADGGKVVIPMIEELRFKQIASQIEQLFRKEASDNKLSPADKEWIDHILDKTNAFAKQLIEDHFRRHKVEVYTRPECPFNYCDDPEECKKLDRCHHSFVESVSNETK